MNKRRRSLMSNAAVEEFLLRRLFAGATRQRPRHAQVQPCCSSVTAFKEAPGVEQLV